MARSQCRSLLVLLALVALAWSPAGPRGFLAAPGRQRAEEQAAGLAAAAALGAAVAPLPAFASALPAVLPAELVETSVSLATNLPPFEDPALIWVWQLSCFSMSLALVVWGRNGF
ncbi:unnamed protein product [Polarella glacialis]|uniref:Cytochrome b6-f complex subunit PetN n=1 Tax=Polarella glacialis TaxID=89957 RepID=A0A813GQP9_POLGL|nr:unnamed protein product [Polarella glacialis]CAE8631583.1 unnamed protein product [Polarella glacialis]